MTKRDYIEEWLIGFAIGCLVMYISILKFVLWKILLFGVIFATITTLPLLLKDRKK